LIKAIVGAVKRIVGNPFVVLPSLLSVAILLFLAYIFAPFAIDLLLDAVILEMVPDAPLNAMPFQFIAIYSTQVFALLIFALLSSILFTALNYWYVVYTKMGFDGDRSLAKACGETISGLGKVIAFIVFVLLVAMLFAVLFWVVSMVAAALGVALSLLDALM